MKRKLWVFCLEYNKDSILVSHAYYWIRELSKYFDEITVICVRANSIPHARNVNVVELSGGSARNRIRALLRLMKITVEIFISRKESVIFHHMLIQPLAIFGWLYRVFKVPQILWYSHSAKSMVLRIGYRFCNSVVSPSQDCFPLKNSKKVIGVGHGIPAASFEKVWSNSQRRNAIVVVGRISRIKNIHLIVEAVSVYQVRTNQEVEIDLIGPILDNDYYEYLKTISTKLQVKLQSMPAQNSEVIPSLLSKYRYSFNGNPQTLDKSAVEAVLAGCFLLTEVEPALNLTGMKTVWSDLGLTKPALVQQLSILQNFNQHKVEELRKQLFMIAKINNDLAGTIERIISVFKKIQT